MKNTLGEAPIEPQYKNNMVQIASTLDRVFNGDDRSQGRKTGFILLVFPFGGSDGRVNYISNGADRKDVITMLKEQIARFEGQPEIKGNA
jgi:hypothetical protein